VKAAADAANVDKLLLLDELLFRPGKISSDAQHERAKYALLVEEVRAAGGAVHMFSAMHGSGEQLKQLTGVAAVLRYGMDDMEDMPVEEDVLMEDVEQDEKKLEWAEDSDLREKDKDKEKDKTKLKRADSAAASSSASSSVAGKGGRMMWDAERKKVVMEMAGGEIVDVDLRWEGELSDTDSEDGLSDVDGDKQADDS
jgi:hypothetical protein